MIRLRPRDPLNQAPRWITMALPIDVLAQPPQQPTEIAARKRRVEVSKVVPCLCKQLRPVDVAKGVCREVADQPRRPVAVLQTAFRIVGWRDTEVGVIR